MLDDRSMKRSPKKEVLKAFPKASCHKVEGSGYVVLSNEESQKRILGEGRSAWDAWMFAEMNQRQ